MPHAGITALLSAFAPVTALVIITFTATPRGRRRAPWGEFGLNRSSKRLWPFALVVPMLLAGSAYGAALVLDVADLWAVAVVGALLLARARVWRTDTGAVDVPVTGSAPAPAAAVR